MSFYHLPHPYNPGYAIPKYVLAEPPERGTFTTRWLPRGTISSLVPDYLAKPGAKLLGRDDADLGSLSGHCLSGHSLAGHSLAGHTLAGDVLRGGDRMYRLESLGAAGPAGAPAPGGGALSAYGKRVAHGILARMRALPQADRRMALRTLLDGIDKSLWSSVDARARQMVAAGVPAPAALERALAQCLSRGLVREVVAVGKRAVRGDRRAPTTGQLGLAGMSAYDALDELGGIWSSIKSAAGDVWDKVEDAAKWVGKQTCNLVTSDKGQGAIKGAVDTTPIPSQITEAGLALVDKACGSGAGKGKPAAKKPAPAKKTTATFVPPPPKSSTPTWLVPVGAGAAALLLLGAG